MARVMEIIAEETGVSFQEVSKNGPGSAVLSGQLGDVRDE